MQVAQLEYEALGCNFATGEGVIVEFAWGLLHSHDRLGVHMDMSEEDWGVFLDCWAEYERITAPASWFFLQERPGWGEI